MKVRLTLLGVACCLLSSLAGAADWPQWRGPKRDGLSPETGLLKAWPKGGPKLLWSFKDAGLGFSSFAVADGKLYTLGTRGNDEIVLALDAEQGTELWAAKVGPIFTFPKNIWGDGPRGTPTVDGTHLYALGGQGDLVCLDLSQKGKEVWRESLLKDFAGEMMTKWGYSESPLVDGEQLIVTPGGKDGTLAALNKKTGAVVWRSTGLTHKATYGSAVAADIQGTRQYVQLSYVDEFQGAVISGFAAKDGKVLWTLPALKGGSYAISTTPIVKDNLIYISVGNGGGGDGAAQLIEIGKGQKAKARYRRAEQKNMKNDFGGVVLVGEHVYGHSLPKSWACQELMTGEQPWLERGELSSLSGATISADGMLYLFTDEGEVALVEADPKEFKLVSAFSLPAKSKFPGVRPSSQQSKVWAHPAIANGRLYLRDAELIFCYDIRAKK